jgi:2-phospho-L-lactate transferase/gluconeogenesis factor (CofD/UPF0052 family)/glycosyltransferase involved in cell wall biosynthesis
MNNQKEGLKVVLFSGGRGTGSISDALLKYPDIELTMLVNAYDDGKSTGLLRRFIPGMLGPSDIRKVVSSLLKHRPDRTSQALCYLIEYRLPDGIKTAEAMSLIDQLIHWHIEQETDHEILRAKEQLSLSQLRDISRYLTAFLHHYQTAIKENPWFTFADNSLGNLFFAGCFLLSGNDFNQAITNFCDFAEVGQRVVNVTHGENLVLTGIKEDGRFLANEATVQGPQDPTRIEEIFLHPNYVDAQTIEFKKGKNARIEFLRESETLPHLNPVADKLLREADIIIYGPGTQHSSLYPSYLTLGIAEAINSNTRAEKIFIANIARDVDILAENASTLVKGFTWYMSRKETLVVDHDKLVTRFFFQKPDAANAGANYLPFIAGEFEFPLEKVVWIDLEGDMGKHSGGRTVSELLIIVEEQLRKRIRHVPHKVSIVVPVLNEKRTIQKVLQNLRDVQFSDLGLEKEIIVIDGGSTDDSVSMLHNEPGIRFYELNGKKGRGMALRYGIEKARGEIIVFFPSDGEYMAQDISRVVSPLINQEFPVVFGSRAFRSDLSGTLQRVYGNRGALFTMSKYGGMLMSVMTLLIYQRYIGDPLTSIKGFNARVFRDMEFRRAGVDFDMELIAKVARAKYSILEVPVNYKARTVKEGKKITVGDGVKCLITLMRFANYSNPASLLLEARKALTREQRA